MAQRVTIRKRTPYNTTSNRRRVVKTPGGRLVYHHLKKPGTAPKCGDCGIALPGIPALRPRQYATVSKRIKTVRRAYGGSRCGDCVKSRCVSFFFPCSCFFLDLEGLRLTLIWLLALCVRSLSRRRRSSRR